MNWRSIACALGVSLLLGCGASQNPRDDDMTADEHDQEAQREDRIGDEHEAQFDPDAQETNTAQPVNAIYYGTDMYNPTARHLAEADTHRDHANEHRARAAELRAFEAEECGRFPAETRASCPLLLGLSSLEDIDGGIQLSFDAETDFAPVIDHVRCHLAFAAAQGREGIDHCALYVLGTRMDVDGHVVRLTTNQANLVGELRNRVRVQEP